MFKVKLINIGRIVYSTLAYKKQIAILCIKIEKRKRERDYDKIFNFNVYNVNDITNCKCAEC